MLIQISPIEIIILVNEALNFFSGIKNLIIPNGIIIKASIRVLITKTDKEKIPIKALLKLIITHIRVMVFLINNQSALRIYFYDIQYFQKSVLLLWLFSCKVQYRIHQ